MPSQFSLLQAKQVSQPFLRGNIFYFSTAPKSADLNFNTLIINRPSHHMWYTPSCLPRHVTSKKPNKAHGDRDWIIHMKEVQVGSGETQLDRTQRRCDSLSAECKTSASLMHQSKGHVLASAMVCKQVTLSLRCLEGESAPRSCVSRVLDRRQLESSVLFIKCQSCLLGCLFSWCNSFVMKIAVYFQQK